MLQTQFIEEIELNEAIEKRKDDEIYETDTEISFSSITDLKKCNNLIDGPPNFVTNEYC